ncbi:hypothetical protein [Pilimelia columellifera]|uniref:Terminase small subunit n=1 Tax=Pilimelia columellifera subsp. columellifera TaxID=706583 RepID=A0ABP6AY00_9ACTN
MGKADHHPILQGTSAPEVEEARKVDLQLIDQLIDRLWRTITASDSLDLSAKNNASATLLKALDRRARYLGLDAPAAAEVTVTHRGPADAELAQMISEAKMRASMPITDEVPEDAR